MFFSDNYTQNVKDIILDYENPFDKECAQINEEIENVSENTTKTEFVEKLNVIKNEYRCSSRRFLAEYMKRMANKVLDDGSFIISYGDNNYHFSGSGMEKILVMEKQEKEQYIEVLSRISMDNSGENASDKRSRRKWTLLYRKAMLLDPDIPILNRTEVFQIAHGLRFTLDMAGEYLTRATDNDYFDYNNADDLIEIYGFLHSEANNYHVIEKLKQRYKNESENISRRSLVEKPQDFTAMIQKSFPEMIREWERDLDTPVEDRLLEWILEKTPYLNMVSKTAQKVYARLARLAYQVINDQNIMNDREDMYLSDFVIDYCRDEGQAEEIDVYQLQDKILKSAANSFDNKRIRNKKLLGNIWRYITLNEKGEIKTRAIGDAIYRLVTGEQPVTKADLLFMIWFVCELLWGATQEEVTFFDQLSDFWTISEDLLMDCMLPVFYAPHLLEWSMLMSICLGSEKESPFEIYESICEELNPVYGRVRKTNEEKELDEITTKKRRKLMEAELREDFKHNRTRFDGTEQLLLEHLFRHGHEKGQYVFEKEGISFYPNPAIVVSYACEDTINKFDVQQPDYYEETKADDRLTYLYSLFLYLRRECKKNGIHLKCRINYRKNCMMQILEYS